MSNQPRPTSRVRARHVPALGALAVAVACALAAPAHAATFSVTTLADDGVGSLRAAIALANEAPGPDTVSLETLSGSITLLEQIVVTDSVAIVGPGRDTLALDGRGVAGQAPGNRIFDISPEDFPETALRVSIADLTLRNGRSTNDGGCVRARFTDLELVDSRITGCMAGAPEPPGKGAVYSDGDGGGIAVVNILPARKRGTLASSSLRVSGSLIEGNAAGTDNGLGGGIAVDLFGQGASESIAVEIVDSTISGNTARASGGIDIATYNGGNVEVRDSFITGNSASDGSAGGLALYQPYSAMSQVSIDNTVFDDNSVAHGGDTFGYGSIGGGGLWIGSSARVAISNGRFDDNTVSSSAEGPGTLVHGGGVAIEAVRGELPSVEVRDSTFSGNSAPYGGGLSAMLRRGSPKAAAANRRRPAPDAVRAPSGKLAIDATGVHVVDTGFTANTAGTGAAILSYLADFDNLPPPKGELPGFTTTFERVTASDNFSTGDGFVPLPPAAFMAFSSGGVSRLVNATISGNRGGGVALLSAIPGEVLTIDHGTITDNPLFGIYAQSTVLVQGAQHAFRAATAGKAYPMQGNPLAVRNSIVAGNLDSKDQPVDIQTSDVAYTLLHALVGMDEEALSPFTDAGGNLFGADPLLGPLADNGGATQTHLPLAGSAAIDAGDPDFATPPDTDQRGEPRVSGDALDIGAVEVAAAPPEPGVLQFDPPAPGMLVEVNPTATLLVARTGGTDGVATVEWATNGITATPGLDYVEASGTLTWADGDGEPKLLSVTLIDDTLVEDDETFGVTLTEPTGAALGEYVATTVTLIDDDVAAVPGVLGFAATAVAVDEAAGTATLSVTRTGGDDGSVGVAYASSNGSATAGSDYTAVSGTLTWADGDTAPKTITVPITDDTLDEPDETFGVTLSAPTGDATLGATAATVTIHDDDVPGVVGFEGADEDGVLRLRIEEDGSVVAPNKGLLTIDVVRTAGSAGPASVDYATIEGTATAPEDFAATSGTLRWADGETGAKSIAVPIVEDDGVAEPDETFGIVLSNAQGVGLDGNPEAEITIVANGTVEPAPAAPAVIPAGDWRGQLALFGALLVAGFVALRRRVS